MAQSKPQSNKPGSSAGDKPSRDAGVKQMPAARGEPTSKQQSTGMPDAGAPDNTITPDTSRAVKVPSAHDDPQGRQQAAKAGEAKPSGGDVDKGGADKGGTNKGGTGKGGTGKQGKPDEPGQKPSKAEPSLSYSQASRGFIDTNPAQRENPTTATTGNANMTAHDANDPALRRSAPGSQAPEAVGSAHSAPGPLARDGATPRHEDERRAQDQHDADQRGRLKGVAPREHVENWRETEKDQQGDLPGRPRDL